MSTTDTNRPRRAGPDTTVGRTSFSNLFSRRPGYREHPLRVWPYTWESMGWFAAAFVVLTAAFTAVGLAITNWWEPSSIGQSEADINKWLEDNRTETLNTVAEVLSIPSDTPVKIGLVFVMLIAFPLVLRRWHDWAFVVGALILEVSVYGASSWIVGRPRPDVERLTSAPTESFPSGHMAAAVTFYVGLAIIVYWNTTNKTARTVAVAAGALIPIGMFISRLYLGMHYVSDMIGGIILGILSLVIALNIARDGLTETLEEETAAVPPHVADLDLTPDDA